MSKGNRRRNWKAQAERKRDPWGQKQTRPSKRKGRKDKSQPWRDAKE